MSETVEQEFERLADLYHLETCFMSMYIHNDTMKEIVALGKPVLPYIFRDMEIDNGRAHWYEAVRQITGENPWADFPTEHAGHIELLNKHGIQWAKANGYY